MECVDEPDPETFAARVVPWLERAPVLNSLVRAVLDARLSGRSPVWGGQRWIRVVDDGQLMGVVAWTRPGVPLLSAMPAEAAAAAGRYLVGPGLTGVTGPVPAADAFAHAVVAQPRALMHFGIFGLERVIPPPRPAPGRLRQATEDDRGILVRWWRDFAREAVPQDPEPDVEAIVDRGLEHDGLLWLWDDDGPSTLVGASPPAGGVIRIAPVYTPPDMRGRGYASSAVAGVSQRALDSGAVALNLYTDLANPTSNAIYRRIGYRRVGDAREWDLSR